MDTLATSDILDAEDILCQQPEEISNWLCGDCLYSPQLPWIPLQTDIEPETMKTPALLVFAFDVGQRASLRIAAINELRDRYLKVYESHVCEEANRIAEEREGDRA
jgi:hypothetical protein